MTSWTAQEQSAVIDIGSNTVRLVIFGGPPRAPQVLLNEKVTARLGKGLGENGQLSGKSMATALAALQRFAMLLKLGRVRTVETVATAAVREATNGMQFLEDVKALGLKPRLLSGEGEAVNSAMGVIGAFPGAKGVVADLGGGSLELVEVDGVSCTHGVSLPFGSLRLPELRAAGAARFNRRITRGLLDSGWSGEHAEPLYLVGGSHRAFARHAMQHLGWPLDDPHGFELTPEAALSVCRSLQRGSIAPETSILSGSRLTALPDTAAMLAVLIRELKPSRLVFSSWGLREGLLYAGRRRAIQQQDPLVAGISAFTEAMGSPAATSAMVAGWTSSANPNDGTGRESLRLAATMLSLAAHSIEPNLRAEMIVDWAMRKRWIGVDLEGRAILAICALASANRKAPELVTRFVSAPLAREAEVWGHAIRICRRLSGLSPQVIANSSLSVQDTKLVLTVSAPFAALATEVVEKDMRQLAEKLGLEASVIRR